MKKNDESLNKNSLKFFINVLTLLRVLGIIIIPFINGKIYRFLFLNLLFLTDFLDGYIARKFSVTSQTGAILDLFADKFLVIVLLVVYTAQGDLFLLIAVLLIIREVYSMGLRIYYLYFSKEKKLIEASLAGKTKTFLQFIAFDLLVLDIVGYQLLFVIIVILSYYSLLQYIKIPRREKR